MKLVRAFTNVDMRCQHTGLGKLLAKAKVSLETSGADEHYIFINAARNKVKTLNARGLLTYLKLPNNRPFDMDCLQYIPQAFGSDGRFEYSKALALSLERRMARGNQSTGPRKDAAQRRS